MTVQNLSSVIYTAEIKSIIFKSLQFQFSIKKRHPKAEKARIAVQVNQITKWLPSLFFLDRKDSHLVSINSPSLAISSADSVAETEHTNKYQQQIQNDIMQKKFGKFGHSCETIHQWELHRYKFLEIALMTNILDS